MKASKARCPPPPRIRGTGMVLTGGFRFRGKGALVCFTAGAHFLPGKVSYVRIPVSVPCRCREGVARPQTRREIGLRAACWDHSTVPICPSEDQPSAESNRPHVVGSWVQGRLVDVLHARSDSELPG